MTELEQRIEHLEKVLYNITLAERNENSFERIYKILKEEYHLEGGETKTHMGSYNDNLRQTISKQAAEYIYTNKKRPKKGAPVEYESFVRNFKHDVSDELNRCKYKLNPPTSGE